jgi:hypothetical protein
MTGALVRLSTLPPAALVNQPSRSSTRSRRVSSLTMIRRFCSSTGAVYNHGGVLLEEVR